FGELELVDLRLKLLGYVAQRPTDRSGPNRDLTLSVLAFDHLRPLGALDVDDVAQLHRPPRRRQRQVGERRVIGTVVGVEAYFDWYVLGLAGLFEFARLIAFDGGA